VVWRDQFGYGWGAGGRKGEGGHTGGLLVRWSDEDDGGFGGISEMGSVPPGGRSGALKGERFSRLGVLGGVAALRARARRRRVSVMASQMVVRKRRAA